MLGKNKIRIHLLRILGGVMISLVVGSSRSIEARADKLFAKNQQENPPAPGELIEAVNHLRVSQSLGPLTIHPILMQIAQMQADALLASDGAVGHTRPGGLTLTDQIILLGYPLAGDLSMGGYRSENFIAAFPDMPVEDAIEMWLGDSLHANTMLSPYYQDIGAGIAFNSDGTGFFVIDCARPTESGQPQPYTPIPGLSGTAGMPDLSAYVQPVILATARPDGDVIHVVGYGQSLWSIAIAYGTRIDEIRRLNNIADLTIYTGQKLLVLKGATQPPPFLSEVMVSTPSPLPARGSSSTPVGVAVAPENITPQNQSLATTESSPNSSLTTMIFGLLLLALLLGGLVTWLTNPKTND